MNELKFQRLVPLVLNLMLGVAGIWLFAYCHPKQTDGHRTIVSFATAKPVLEALANELPSELRKPSEAKWKAWSQHEDNVVRARLEQGVLDSMVNLLLFGTSFTAQPRVVAMHDFEDAVVQFAGRPIMQHPHDVG